MSKSKTVTLPLDLVGSVIAIITDSETGAGQQFIKECWAVDILVEAMKQPDASITTSVPAGWKLVPVEPTRDMLTKWIKAVVVSNTTAPDLYQAMLASAPQPPAHYDQQALDLCLTCGWKTMIPGDCCLNCARQKPQGEQEPVAWCALNADRSGIAYFDGRPIIMTGPIGNEHHPDPLYTNSQPKREPPQVDPAPHLYYDPNNGNTWTQEAINDGCCLPDGLIALYTK